MGSLLWYHLYKKLLLLTGLGGYLWESYQSASPNVLSHGFHVSFSVAALVGWVSEVQRWGPALVRLWWRLCTKSSWALFNSVSWCYGAAVSCCSDDEAAHVTSWKSPFGGGVLKGQESLEPQGNALLTVLLASKAFSCYLLGKSFIWFLSMDMSAVVPEMVSHKPGARVRALAAFLLLTTSKVFGLWILQAWAYKNPFLSLFLGGRAI